MLDIVLRWAVPFFLGGAVTFVVTYIKMRHKRDRALEQGVQCLLRGEIIRDHKEYTAKGYCPVYAREALVRSYKAYHALGGNDVATELYETVMHLPVKDTND